VVAVTTKKLPRMPVTGSRTSPRIRTSRSPASALQRSANPSARNFAGPCSVPPARPTESIGTPRNVSSVIAVRLAFERAAHGQPVLLVEPVKEPVLPRVDTGGERPRTDARLRALADLPVLARDQVPELDHRFRLEVRTLDRLRAEEELAHHGGVVRTFRVGDVVHAAVGVQVQH